MQSELGKHTRAGAAHLVRIQLIKALVELLLCNLLPHLLPVLVCHTVGVGEVVLTGVSETNVLPAAGAKCIVIYKSVKDPFFVATLPYHALSMVAPVVWCRAAMRHASVITCRHTLSSRPRSFHIAEVPPSDPLRCYIATR